MATVSQRRKGTTYGKAYRKPLIHASFATDNLSQPAQQRSWKCDAAENLATPVQEHGLSRDSSDLSRNNTSRVANIEQSPRINVLYDPPLSDEEPPSLRDMLEDGHTESKRRKLTLSSISDDELAMFDEQGLQTHSSQVRPKTAVGSRSNARRGGTHAMPLTSKDGKLASKTNSRRLPASKGLSRKEHLTEPLQRKEGRREEKAAPQHDPTVARKIASKQHKRSIVDAVSDHTQSYKHKGLGAPRAPISNHTPRPTTPPQPSSGSGSPAATTPRQRDLWNRLLPGDGRSESPGGLGLPNLRLADSGHSPFEDTSPAPSHRIQRPRSCISPPQRLRLIDKLKALRRDANSPSSQAAEDVDGYESINSDESLTGHRNNEACRFHDTPAPALVTEVMDHETTGQKKEMTVPTITGNGVPPTQAGSLKVTYAQQQRTFLTETLDCNPSSSQLIDMSLDRIQAPKPRDVVFLASRKPSDDEEYELGVQEASEPQGGAMRSIHELRQAGGNVRLAEELESFLDELEGSAIGSSSRRAALVAIVCKLQESASCRLFTDKGMVTRLVSQSDPCDDLIIKSLFSMAFLRLLTTSNSGFPPPAERGMKEVLSSLLDAELDLTRCAKRREFNMSKVALQEFVKVCESFLDSKCWQSDKLEYLSGRLLSLQCLSCMIRQKREANDGTQLLSTGQVQLLAATTIPETAKLPSLNNAARRCLQLAISVLESCTVGGTADCERSWPDDVLRRVAGVLPTLDASWTDDWERLQILTLQLYLNLTNGVPYLCGLFAQTQVVETSFNIVEAFFKRSDTRGVGHGHSLLDRAILALGCLINFAEGCEAMRELVLRQTHRGQSFLQLLLDLFLANSARVAEVYSEEESTSNVAYGYMTVLLCYLCLNKAVREAAEERLPGQTLTPLLEAMEEFLQYHRQIERDRDLPAEFASRLQALADRLKC